MLANLAQIISVPAILLLVYGILSLYRRVTCKQKGAIWHRLIPLWAMLLGTFLGIFMFTMFPEITPAPSLFTAILLGATAGLGATGLNQLMHQLFTVEDKKEEEEKTEKDTEAKS